MPGFKERRKRMLRRIARRMLIVWFAFPVTIFLLFVPLAACKLATSLSLAHSPSLHLVKWTAPLRISGGNPASKYCIRVGGSVTMHKRGDGHIFRLCQFTDNRACEEWALLRGDCPVGGVRITGFDTIAQQYCAWLGGETLAVPHATCTLPDGKVCNDDALYNGKCDDPALQPRRNPFLFHRFVVP